jgi:hypothetical protein
MPDYSEKKFIGRAWIIAGAIALVVVIVYFVAPSWTCVPFRLGEIFDPGELPAPLPPNCVSSGDEPSDATSKSLEDQRQQMGLTLLGTTTCKVLAVNKTHRLDPQWVQKMYVAGMIHYQRHVLIATTEDVNGGTLFVVERCLMPWWKYVNEAGDDCWAQLEFWK